MHIYILLEIDIEGKTKNRWKYYVCDEKKFISHTIKFTRQTFYVAR